MKKYSNSYIGKRIKTKLNIIRAGLHKDIIQPDGTKSEPIFIISSGRAGTTILQRCLMNGGQIHIPPESGECIPQAFELYVSNIHAPWKTRAKLVLDTFRRSSDFSYWDIDPFENFDSLLGVKKERQRFCSVIDHIYGLHALKRNPSAIRWGDKTPILCASLDRLHACYPSAYYLNVVRDPRDVVASRMRAFNESLTVALNRWLTAYNCAAKWQNSGRLNMLTLRYEDLVTYPESKLKELCEFANLNYSSRMLEDHVDIDSDYYRSLAHLKNTEEALRIGGMPPAREILQSHNLTVIEKATKKQRYALNYP